MADLDAFFSDVAAAEAEVVTTSEITESASNKPQSSETIAEASGPPSKKRKMDDSSDPSATLTITALSSVSAKPMSATESMAKNPAPSVDPSVALPPPPPPLVQPNAYGQQYAQQYAQQNHNNFMKKNTAPAAPVAKVEKQTKTAVRSAAGQTWVDHSLEDWPANDFRLFVGDLAKEVNQAMLEDAFKDYKSLAKAKIVYDKKNGKSKGYGFVSFLDAKDAALCIRQMNDKYVGGRPIKIKKSDWKDRDIKEVKKKKKKEDKRRKEWS